MSSQLQSHDVIPDVLPSGTQLSQTLVVKWPKTTLDNPGAELDREETQSTPTLWIESGHEEQQDGLVLIMTDPDLMTSNDSTFGQVRHWFATKVSVGNDGALNIPDNGVLSPYVGPAPLPNYVTQRKHRYVFILCRPKVANQQQSSITEQDLKVSQHKYSGAFEGKQDLQDLKDRWGFNAADFIKSKELEVVAATFMLVGGNVNSAADNLKMTAEGVKNKVCS